MSHFGTETEIKNTTPSEWLKVGADIGRLVNNWAVRSDLVAHISETIGSDHGAPAAFNPKSAEIEVNTEVAFGKAKAHHIGDLNDRANQFEFPKACGAIFHEACHARFTTWDLYKASKDLTPSQNRALHLLEESRIERLGAVTTPANKVFLRTSALEIVLADMSEEEIANLTTTRQVAHLIALTYARVDAGVLEPEDIDPIRSTCEGVLPDEVFEKLRSIWKEFQFLSGENETRMYELAIEWDKTVQDQAKENGEGEEESGSGEGVAISGALAEAIAEAIKEAQESTELDAQGQAYTQQTQEEYDEQAKASQSANEEKRQNEQKASEVFSKGSQPTDSKTNSRLVETRKPTSEERISAVKIAQALERAKYRDRDKVVSGSVVPPGRLRTRSVTQGEALKARGIYTPVEAFRRVQHKQVDDPTLTVGVMVDISGSMSDAMKPMASSAWIMSEAVRRVQGKVAMVYYGNDVFPTLKPGQHLENVNVYSAPDGTEKFDDGFRALDGALNLLNGTGARLLVIVSDGEYTSPEQANAKKWIARCQRDGVGVLWIGAGYYSSRTEENYCSGDGVSFAKLGESATDASMEIGRRATEALTTAGSRR